MLRSVLFVLAAICFLLLALTVHTEHVNLFYLGLFLAALGFASESVDVGRRR